MTFSSFLQLFSSIFPFSKYEIHGRSMSPTFSHGDIVLVNRLAYILKRPTVNDVVVLTDPRNGLEVLKRITKINDGYYFVEGDNKQESTDSRNYGPVAQKQIIGKVIYCL